VIPTRKDQRRLPSFERPAYRRRDVVERCIGRLKESRRLATRCEKLAEDFPAMVKLAMLEDERLSCGGWLGHQLIEPAQNASHCSASPLNRALRWHTASAPSSTQRIPLRFSRSLTTVLHAASMCPDPICQPDAW
jgi:hypothetical protein